MAAGWPTGCRYYVGGANTGWATCTGGSGYFKVTIACRLRTGGPTKFYDGASWKRPGRNSWSLRACAEAGEVLLYAGITQKAG
jgi:hypothetical protein